MDTKRECPSNHGVEIRSRQCVAEWIFRAVGLERVMGIEPTFKAWEALVLPLDYTR